MRDSPLEDGIFCTALILIAIVLVFELTNGFNDCANLVASSITTGALGLRSALLLVGFFEFIGAWFLGTAVAKTLGEGIVNPLHIPIAALFAALIGSIIWNLLCFYGGMPSSSSHALIGGLLGAVLVGSDAQWIHWKKLSEILAILIVAPAIGLLAGRFLTLRIFDFLSYYKPSKANRLLKRLQILTSITLALSHGSNDAQKGMGIISLALILFHKISPSAMNRIYEPLPQYSFYVPSWVILACSLALATGVSFGGLRIMKTLGAKLYRMRPIHGFSAQGSASLVIYLSSLIGYPVSTTQIVSSSIIGAGTAQSLSAVRWGVGRQIIITWLITIPGAAALAALLVFLFGVLPWPFDFLSRIR
jgi:PiT family inorganic phosphate transporter